jgi:hypothetical protein
MQINWLRVTGAVASTILSGAILYGTYQYYFGKKPQQTIQNYNSPVTQNHYEIKHKQHLITGIYGGKNKKGWEGGVSIGWLW